MDSCNRYLTFCPQYFYLLQMECLSVIFVVFKVLHSSVEEMVQKGTKVPEKRSMAKNSLRSHYLL